MKKKLVERNDEYFRALYSSKRRLKKCVLWHERYVAQAVATYLGVPSAKPNIEPRLNSDIEWLLTWKLKTGCCPRMMWCDGLENLKVRRIGSYSIAIKSDIWIGPEDGSAKTSKGTLLGEIEVRHTSKNLKSYTLVISHENSVYTAKKT